MHLSDINQPELGAKKNKLEFLFIPKCLAGKCKWLKLVRIEYSYERGSSLLVYANPPKKIEYYYWKPLRFTPRRNK